MSKFRRNNVGSSPRNMSNSSDDDHHSGAKLKLNRGKLISHDAFLNRIQKTLYYGGSKAKISIPLSDYIADSFSETHTGYSLNRLNYATVGNLRSTPCSLILAMIYLERMKDADPAYTKHVTPTELFLVSMMVATKFYSGHDDEAPYVNWAECMNVTPDTLLDIELAFLNAMDWKVYVSNEEFYEKVELLERTLAQQQGLHRGWLTYIEMNTLLPPIQIAKHFLQTIIVFGLSYTLFVATMVASVLLVSQIPGTYLNAPQQTRTTQTTAHLQNTSQSIANDTKLPAPTNIIADIDNTDIEASSEDLLNRLNGVPDLQIMENQTNEWGGPYTFLAWYRALQQSGLEWAGISNSFNRQRITVNSFGIDYNELLSPVCNSTVSTGIYPIRPIGDRIKINFNGVKLKFV